MRTGHHSNQLEIELTVRKIPFVKYGGIEYTNTAHVRDLLAALRLVHNRRDELAWFRLLCRHRAIGKATARSLTAALLATDTTADYPDVAAGAPAKARTALFANPDRPRSIPGRRGPRRRPSSTASTPSAPSSAPTTPTGPGASKTWTGSPPPPRPTSPPSSRT